MRAAARPCLRLLLALALLAAGCEEALLSKEQRQEIDRIRATVTSDPDSANRPDADGEPPLHVAVTGRYRSLLSWLLARGADPAVRDRSGWTALHHAVFSDRAPGFPIACLLLRRGLGVDSATEDGQSPLHFAAASTRPDAVAFLLGENADPNRRTALGATPLHSAATPQPFAPADDVRRTIRLLADHGAALGARASNGETPLHRAALIGSSVAVQALLEVRADADAPGGAGWTPLHMAAVFGTADAAEALLAGGAHVDRLDDEGRTPLWRALHAPAGYGSAQRVGTVDTRDVVTVLRRYGGTEGNP